MMTTDANEVAAEAWASLANVDLAAAAKSAADASERFQSGERRRTAEEERLREWVQRLRQLRESLERAFGVQPPVSAFYDAGENTPEVLVGNLRLRWWQHCAYADAWQKKGPQLVLADCSQCGRGILTSEAVTDLESVGWCLRLWEGKNQSLCDACLYERAEAAETEKWKQRQQTQETSRAYRLGELLAEVLSGAGYELRRYQ
jgi:hypothetical protein